MNKLIIPESHIGITKTLRIPENMVNDIQNLANVKNMSFNKIVVSLLQFGLDNLNEDDKNRIKK
ncbi:MAG: hypothetical protein J6N78_00825 [Clostridia bacterium]|nr:hypothetical protein [Clostridia bacterium]